MLGSRGWSVRDLQAIYPAPPVPSFKKIAAAALVSEILDRRRCLGPRSTLVPFGPEGSLIRLAAMCSSFVPGLSHVFRFGGLGVG